MVIQDRPPRYESCCCCKLSASAGRSAIVSRLSSERLKILLQIYLIPIDLEQYGSLEKSHRENEVHRPLNVYNNSNDSGQHSFFDAYPLAGLKKWKGLQRKLCLHGCLQRSNF